MRRRAAVAAVLMTAAAAGVGRQLSWKDVDATIGDRDGARVDGTVPLLLLHGLGGGRSTWDVVAQRLARDRRVLVPDLLGFGRSPWPDVPYTVEDHLTALEEFLARRGLAGKQIDVAGHSMGAILAAELAARRPGAVRSLALVSLPYFRTAQEAQASIGNLGAVARLTALGHWTAGALCGVMCATRPVLNFLAPHFAPHVPAAVARDALRHNFASYSRSLQHLVIQHRLEPAIRSLAGRPVRLLHGEVDRTAPVENVRDLAASQPLWRLRVVAGGHHLPIDMPQEVTELLGGTWVGTEVGGGSG